MLSQIETVQFEPNCIKTGVLMLWMQHKKVNILSKLSFTSDLLMMSC